MGKCDQCGGPCCAVCGICKACDGNECGVHADNADECRVPFIDAARSAVPAAFVTLPDVDNDASRLTVRRFLDKYRGYVR
jgi:hypothetical protein